MITNNLPIDTAIIVRVMDKEKTFLFPYVTHLQNDDLLDDGEKPFKMRVAFGTTDSKVKEFKQTFQELLHFLDAVDYVDTVQVFSGDRVLRMRRVTVLHTHMKEDDYLEFETLFSDALGARINGANDVRLRETWN